MLPLFVAAPAHAGLQPAAAERFVHKYGRHWQTEERIVRSVRVRPNVVHVWVREVIGVLEPNEHGISGDLTRGVTYTVKRRKGLVLYDPDLERWWRMPALTITAHWD